MTYQESQVHKCPVCDGGGNYPPNDYTQRQCHGCEGKGWVVVWVTYANRFSSVEVATKEQSGK